MRFSDSDFDKFFHAKKNFVASIVWKYTRSEDVANDMIQETMIRIYTNFERVIMVEHQNAFVHRITVNTVINYLRKNKKASLETTFDPELHDLFFQSSEDAENAIIAKEVNNVFYSIIDKMTEKRKKIILMRVIEGKSFNEIGEILDITDVNARNIFSVSMKKLKEEMDKRMGVTYA